MGIIYCARNIKNGRLYIGQTKHTLEKRVKEHIKSALHPKTYFHCALRKYGVSGFHWTILERCEDEQIHELEQVYIDLFSTADRKIGYNCTFGGDGLHATPEIAARIGAKNKGRISPRRGYKYTPEELAQHTERMRQRVKQPGYMHPMQGKHHSAESRAKMASAPRPENPNKGQPMPRHLVEKMSEARKTVNRGKGYKKRPDKVFTCCLCREPFTAKSTPAYFCKSCKKKSPKIKAEAKTLYLQETGEAAVGNKGEKAKPRLVGPPKSLMRRVKPKTGKKKGFPKGYTRTWDVLVPSTCSLCGQEFTAKCGTTKFCPECKSKYNEKLLNKMYKAKYGTKPTAPFVNIGKTPRGVTLYLLTCPTCTKSFVCGTITRKQCPECRGQAPTESCYMYEPDSPKSATV